MPKFGKRSRERLAECHTDLQEIMNEVIKIMDITILCGNRGEEEQNKAFNEKRSQLQFPQSKHNKLPSDAIDVAPWNNGIDWSDIKSFEKMCGIIEGIAHMKDIKIRLGRDFSFLDYVHIELEK